MSEPDPPSFSDDPLIAAIVDVVALRGYGEASVEEIVRLAGLSKEDFFLRFADKADAVLRALEAMIADFRRRVGGAYGAASPWPASLRAAAYEVVGWIEDHPRAYEYGMLRVLDAGEMARLRREELFTWCAGLIDAGREVAPDPDAVPHAAPLIAVGAVVDGLVRHAGGELDAGLAETVPKLMYGAVLPYLGEEAARRELLIPPPARQR